MIPPATFNHIWCLPNKFFDFLQARLGIVTGPSPERARIVDEEASDAAAARYSGERELARFSQVIDALVVDRRVA